MDETCEGEELDQLNDIDIRINNLLKEKEELQNLLKAKEKSLLFEASKEGKFNSIEQLVSRGVDVNILDDNGMSPVDYAWTNKFYSIVLLLLKADSKFPTEFNLANLDNESANELKTFVDERNFLRRCIHEGNLQEVQRLVNKNKSKYYFNESNQSAAYAAVQSKKLNILAYLKSIGAEFANQHEKEQADKLELEHKVTLKDAMVKHFPGVSRQHIFYLISKSKAQKYIPGLESILTNFYTKLDQIPEVSMILQVIQHSDYLDVVFDFDNEHVSALNPLCSETTKGETNYKEGRLYIAASPRRGERKILGTTAHEITHMAMQVLFENECNPYRGNDKDGEESFGDISKDILDKIKNIDNDPSQIIYNVKKSYPVRDYHSELIVTVPQILAEFDDGKLWLQKNTPDLLEFFSTKIIPSCQEYIVESHILKAKTAVKKLNETIGELGKLKKTNILFKDIDKIKELLETPNAKIFILTTGNTFLGLVKMMQGTFGKDYINFYDKYLAFEGKKFMSQLRDIIQTFFLDACDTLLIRGLDDFSKDQIMKLLEPISEVLEHKPNKKIILVINPNVEESLIRMLKIENLFDSCVKQRDESPSLNDLTTESKKKVLSVRVKFQGKRIILKNLLGGDEDLHKHINADIIENLIEDKSVYIGGETLDHGSTLRGFNQLNEEVNLKTFIHEFQNSDDIFVIKGFREKYEVTDFFSQFIIEGLIKPETLESEVQIISSESLGPASKRLFLTEELSNENFEKFCRFNWEKKIYFISVENEEEEPKLVLQQLYNPNFYIQRKFNIVLNQGELENLILMSPSENFLITSSFDGLKLTRYYKNVKTPQSTEESIFDDYIKNQGTIHWFHIQSWKEVYWKYSSNSGSNSWLDFKHLKANDKYLVEENDLTKHVAYKKVLVIADNPGMGKSTTLTKLCESTSITRNCWVVRVDLKRHVEAIKSIEANNLTIKSVVNFLRAVKSSFNNQLTRVLLESALTGTLSKQLLFALDGFDEVLDDEARANIVALIKYLKDHTKSKVWITTRPQYKSILEEALSTFAFQFDPIDDENKKTYIKRYLQDLLKLTFELGLAKDIFSVEKYSKLQFYADHLIKVMNNIFSKNVSTFFGTPLQLYLMTDSSVEHFKSWIDKNDPQLDFAYLGNDILNVFSNFIDRKCRIYFKKQNISEDFIKEREMRSAEEYHKALAESLTRNLPLSKKYELDNPLMMFIGLIQLDDEDKVEFIHFTFREYFAALTFTEYISNESSEQKLEFLLEILEKEEFKLVRNFMNLKLGNLNFADLPRENVESFRRIFTSSWEESEFPDNVKEIFYNTVEEDHGNILDFLLYSCKESFTEVLYMKLMETNKQDGLSLLHSSVLKNPQITKIFFNQIDNLSIENQKKILQYDSKYDEIIELAILSGHFEIVKIVMLNLEIILDDHDFELFMENLLSNETKHNFRPTKVIGGMNVVTRFQSMPVLHYLAEKGKNDILEFLIEKMKGSIIPEEQMQIFLAENEVAPSILYVAAKNGELEVMKTLLKLMNDIVPREGQIITFYRSYQKHEVYDHKQEGILHAAAKNGNVKIMELLLAKGEELSIQKNFFTMETSTFKNVFHIASYHGHTKLVKMLLHKATEFFTPEELYEIITKKVGTRDETVLHLTARGGHTEVMATWLEKCEELFSDEVQEKIITMENAFSQTVLHIAVANNYNDLTKMLLTLPLFKTKKKLLTMPDNHSQTILHIAVDKGHVEILKTILEIGFAMFEKEEEKEEFVTMIDEYDDTVLHLAAENGNIELMKTLLKYIKELTELKPLYTSENETLKTVFHVASENGHTELIKKVLLSEQSLPLTSEELKKIIMKQVKHGETILHLAAKNGHFQVAELWVEKLSKDERKKIITITNNYSQTILYLAAENGHNEFVQLILAKLKELLSTEEQKRFMLTICNRSQYADAKKETIFHVPVRLDNAPLIEILLEKCKELSLEKEFFVVENSFGKSTLHIASGKDRVGLIKMLLDKINGMSTEDQKEIVTKQTKTHETVLHFAVKKKKVDILKIWLEKCKQILTDEEHERFINIEDPDSNTALNIALENKHTEIIEMLLDIK